ncbi:MAG: hypothetical protein ABIP49_07035 [Lysobacterales bacterium]
MTRAQRLLLVLGIVALLLAAVLTAQKFGLGDGYRLAPLGATGREPAPHEATGRRNAGLESFATYDELLRRPLFNEDRKPTPVDEETTEAPVATVAALDAQLTGVILMPRVKLAMIRENASGKGLRVRLGGELDGALSGWKLVELEPRKAVFEAQGQGRQELELAVDKAGTPAAMPPPMIGMSGASMPGIVQPPPQSSRTGGGATPGAMPFPDKVAMAQPPESGQPEEPTNGSAVEPEQPEVAESIRQRIEERRRQLREEAARLMQQQPQK